MRRFHFTICHIFQCKISSLYIYIFINTYCEDIPVRYVFYRTYIFQYELKKNEGKKIEKDRRIHLSYTSVN